MAATYTYGNALIRKDAETPLFDGLGSERTVTNSSGAVQGTLTLSAFGQTIASTGSSTSAYQYGATSGYRTEGDAGLTLVGCRFYDAQVGRFISRDTDLDQKPYAYCEGDPVNSVDPSGHFLLLLIIVLVAVVLLCDGCAPARPNPPGSQGPTPFTPPTDGHGGTSWPGGAGPTPQYPGSPGSGSPTSGGTPGTWSGRPVTEIK